MSLRELKSQFHCDGKAEWIGIRPARKMGMEIVTCVELMQNMLANSGAKPFTIKPEMLRRNIVISGLNLLSLKGALFQLGNAILEMTEQCHPCSRMEEVLGSGGFNLMRGHGGILAKVVKSGKVETGDRLTFLKLK